MANPFVKAWKYLMALFSSKVDEYADPKVQIQQAIEEAQRQQPAELERHRRPVEVTDLGHLRPGRVEERLRAIQVDVPPAEGDGDLHPRRSGGEPVAGLLGPAPRLLRQVELRRHQLERVLAVDDRHLEVCTRARRQAIGERQQLVGPHLRLDAGGRIAPTGGQILEEAGGAQDVALVDEPAEHRAEGG